MAWIEVRIRLLSGRPWACALPASASVYDVQTLVKSQLGVRRRLQHLILAGSEVHARDPLSEFDKVISGVCAVRVGRRKAPLRAWLR